MPKPSKRVSVTGRRRQQRPSRPDEVVWCNRGWFPVSFGFCPSEWAWHKEMNRLGVGIVPYPTEDACTHDFARTAHRNAAVLVTIRDATTSRDEALALLVHEAAHVFQAICAVIGEGQPSSEFEAYALQNIFIGLRDGYDATRGAIAKGEPRHG